MLQNAIPSIAKQAENLSISEVISLLVNQFPGKVVFSTSFSFEDQVIAHEILNAKFPVTLFTLDTGRLFPETYSVWNSTNEKYHTKIKAYYPEAPLLEKLITEKGPNSFYESVENRKDCCYIRKVEPLKRALSGASVWITGLRAEHSPARNDLALFEWDQGNGVIKYNPILHWTTEQVKQHIDSHDVPYNSLHDKGFVSIGCAPCTRAIRPGEDFRAGRWWWEDSSKKECGLHVSDKTPIEGQFIIENENN